MSKGGARQQRQGGNDLPCRTKSVTKKEVASLERPAELRLRTIDHPQFCMMCPFIHESMKVYVGHAIA